MPGSGERPTHGSDMAKDAIDNAAKALLSQILLHADEGASRDDAITATHVAWDKARHALPDGVPVTT